MTHQNGVCYICGYAAKKQEKFIKELLFIYLFIYFIG
jgi:hypothetical protein